MKAKRLDLGAWLDRMLEPKGYRTRGAIARLCGMKDSGLSKAIKDGALSVEQCLRVAHALRKPPALVIRIARPTDSDIAQIVDDLWPKENTKVNRREQEILKLWRNANDNIQPHVEAILLASSITTADRAAVTTGTFRASRTRRTGR